MADGEKVPITAKVIPQIVPDIETNKYKKAIDACRAQHPDLDLPTFASTSARIHMLLAGAVTNALTGKRVIKVGKQLEVRDTRLMNRPCYASGRLEHNEEEQVTLLTATNWTEKETEKIMLLQDVDEKMSTMVEDFFNQREFQRTDDEDLSREEIINRFEKTSS